MPLTRDLSQRGTAFRIEETHNIPNRTAGLEFRTSERFGWHAVHAAFRRGLPYEASYTTNKHIFITIFINAADMEYKFAERRSRSSINSETYSIIPKNIDFSEKLYSPTDTLRLHLRDSFVTDVVAELFGRSDDMLDISPTIGVSDPLIWRIGTLFNSALLDMAPLSSLQVDHLATILVIRLIQNHTSPLLKHRSGDRKLRERQLREIDEYIHENLQQSIRMDALARIAGSSLGHFIRQFKSTTGLTPHQYVMRVRVDRAKQLLDQNSGHLATIAMDCGFSSQEHMTHVFNSIVGVTPGAFRRLKRSN